MIATITGASNSRANVIARARRRWQSMVDRAQPVASQGVHVDPLDVEERPSWTDPTTVAAFESAEMERFRAALRHDAVDVRTALLSDLAEYHGISVDEVVRRCRNWEADSVAEWSAEDRDDDESLVRFYRTTQSWGFDLVWFAYLQAEGFAEPTSVIALRWLDRNHRTGRRHLDFGSGVGATGQVFQANGWSTALADVSSTLLDLARFRYARRGTTARTIDLTVERPAAGGFDAITALDTITHVPDVAATAHELHRALAPGGHLLANFDVRAATPESAWHLYEDDLGPRYQLEKAGFRPVARLPYGIVAYARVTEGTFAHHLNRVRAWLVLDSPARRGVRRVRTAVLRAAYARRRP